MELTSKGTDTKFVVCVIALVMNTVREQTSGVLT